MFAKDITTLTYGQKAMTMPALTQQLYQETHVNNARGHRRSSISRNTVYRIQKKEIKDLRPITNEANIAIQRNPYNNID